MLLEEKVYTIPEIREWFHISKSTWCNKKDFYLEELSIYCDYDYINPRAKKGQRIIIHHLYEENAREYVKRNKKKEEVIKAITNKFLNIWFNTGTKPDFMIENKECATAMNTVSIVIDEILEENPDLLKQYAKSTLYSLTLGVRKELFGTPFKKYYDEEEGILKTEGKEGKIGRCKRTIAVKKENGRLRYLTAEEQEVVRETARRVYGNDKIADCTSTVAWIKKLQEEGKVTKEEGFDMITSSIGNSKSFYKELNKLGIFMIVATEATVWYDKMKQWVTLVDVTDAAIEIFGPPRFD